MIQNTFIIPYSCAANAIKAFPAIDCAKATLDQYRTLGPAIVRNLQEDLIVHWTCHSNAIEGTRFRCKK